MTRPLTTPLYLPVATITRTTSQGVNIADLEVGTEGLGLIFKLHIGYCGDPLDMNVIAECARVEKVKTPMDPSVENFGDAFTTESARRGNITEFAAVLLASHNSVKYEDFPAVIRTFEEELISGEVEEGLAALFKQSVSPSGGQNAEKMIEFFDLLLLEERLEESDSTIAFCLFLRPPLFVMQHLIKRYFARMNVEMAMIMRRLIAGLNSLPRLLRFER